MALADKYQDHLGTALLSSDCPQEIGGSLGNRRVPTELVRISSYSTYLAQFKTADENIMRSSRLMITTTTTPSSGGRSAHLFTNRGGQIPAEGSRLKEARRSDQQGALESSSSDDVESRLLEVLRVLCVPVLLVPERQSDYLASRATRSAEEKRYRHVFERNYITLLSLEYIYN